MLALAGIDSFEDEKKERTNGKHPGRVCSWEGFVVGPVEHMSKSCLLRADSVSNRVITVEQRQLEKSITFFP